MTFYYLCLDQSYPGSDLQQQPLSQYLHPAEEMLVNCFVTWRRSLAQWRAGLLGLEAKRGTAVAGGAGVGRGGRSRLPCPLPSLVFPGRLGRGLLGGGLLVLTNIAATSTSTSGHGAQLSLGPAGVLALLETLNSQTELPVGAHSAVAFLHRGLPGPGGNSNIRKY